MSTSTEDKKNISNRLMSSQCCETRQEAVSALSSLCKGYRPSISNVHGQGPMLISDIPPSCLTTDDNDDNNGGGVILGIDEAGRGPVLGPMTYGCCFWHRSKESSIPQGFNDSKQLSVETREKLFTKIQESSDIGFVLRVLNGSEISRNMLRKDPYNLNAMSHDSAIQMIEAVLNAGVRIDTCYIDTVGKADYYRSILEKTFNGKGINFVVESKADTNYATCSAASVVAKVSRDHIIESWNWSEPSFEPINGKEYGSGYPSDPTCKEWLERNCSADPVFCMPDFVRFSWGPAKKAVDQNGCKVHFEADDENCGDGGDKDRNVKQSRLNSFMVTVPKKRPNDMDNAGGGLVKKRPKFGYCDKKMKLNHVMKLVEL